MDLKLPRAGAPESSCDQIHLECLCARRWHQYPIHVLQHDGGWLGRVVPERLLGCEQLSLPESTDFSLGSRASHPQSASRPRRQTARATLPTSIAVGPRAGASMANRSARQIPAGLPVRSEVAPVLAPAPARLLKVPIIVLRDPRARRPGGTTIYCPSTPVPASLSLALLVASSPSS